MSRSRNYVFTWNNYPADHHALLAKVECNYLVAGREFAPTTGTPHLQGYIKFRSMKSTDQVKQILPGCHIEKMKGTFEQAINYAKKDGDFIEFGEKPKTALNKGDMERERYKLAYEAAKRGDLDEIDPDILIRHYGSVKRIAADNTGQRSNLSNVCGLWIHGPSGCGKSLLARQLTHQPFVKPLNKWWDGYNGEPDIIIDDVDPHHSSWISYFLKIWGDRYAFIGEAKGTSRSIRPQRVIVTSQYSIEQVFLDIESRDAIKRRFREWLYSSLAFPLFNKVPYE